MMSEPIKIDVIAVYDCEKMYDRYTVVFDDIDRHVGNIPLYTCLCMSSNPNSPLGLSEHSTCMLGKHLGKRIDYNDLPGEIKDHVRNRGYIVNQVE